MKDDPTGQTGADDARRLLEQSERILRELLVAFDEMTGDMMAGQSPDNGDISRAILMLAKTRTTVIQEIQNHDKRVHLTSAAQDAIPLDFDTIRDDIGRRLDRIRASGNSEGFLK